MNQPDYHYLERLNTQQREAVEYLDGPQLVIAGAGSGKTRVLTYKIVHLLNCGYEPGRIMALTFTNKAAREMKERIAALTGPGVASRLWMGTFHSIFLRILRLHADKVGYKSNFSIYDSTDSRNLVKIIIKDMGLNDKNYKASAIAATISNAKNAMMTPLQYEQTYYQQDVKAHRPLTAKIFERYVERCQIANAMDFDDIIFYMNILLRDNEDIRRMYADKFRYILVDEYQDTNYAQHAVVSQLAKPANKVCVVGDDAQSIYSFRGADINNIIELEKAYKGLKIFRLERNYRSTKNIVNAAGSLIEKNTRQLRKEVYSENEDGAPVDIIQTYSDLEEAAMVANRISQLKNTAHDSYEEYAILYRTNAQSRVLEEALRKRAIGYRIYGGTAFYQRKEVKDALSYFRVIVNPNDDESMRRIINFPARGIGNTTMKKIQDAASAEHVSLWDVISNPANYNLAVNSGTLKKLESFSALIQLFIDDNKKSTAYEVGQLVYNRTGMLTQLVHENTPESISRQENLNELLRGMQEFVETRQESGEGEVTLQAFLSEVMLSTDQDEKDATDGTKVTLMTAHAAKGLEFKHVFIVGVEEELFPSAMSMDSLAQVEEERRLLYVAITRAKETCVMSYAKSRFRNGQTVLTSPSRFLSEIDRKYLHLDTTSDLGSDFSNPSINYRKSIYNDYNSKNRRFTRPEFHTSGNIVGHKNPDITNIQKVSTARIPSNGAQHTISELKIGMKIEHSKFGIGYIKEFSSVAGADSIVVDFGEIGIKKLMLGFAKFTILE